MHVAELFHGGADAQGPVHGGLGHGLADGRELVNQAGIGEVAMRINEHVVSKWKKPTRLRGSA